MDQQKVKYGQDDSECYRALKLFCDWAVHSNIDRNKAAEPLIRHFDDAVENVRSGNGIPAAFVMFLSLTNFREQFKKYLLANKLPSSVVDDSSQWSQFLQLYSSVVSDCPISYTKAQFPFKLISSLTLTKDLPTDSYVLQLLKPQKPFDLWMNWRIELTDGTVENWPFYN